MLVKFSTSLLEHDLDAIHVFLTWLWICAGCLVQFLAVCCSICDQDYLSCTWKCIVVLASALLLGPSMVYVYGIIIIIAFKFNWGSALPTERKTMDVLERLMSFASQAKLSELFFESLPQFLTQLLMTSYKGYGGVRRLTPLQSLSG